MIKCRVVDFYVERIRRGVGLIICLVFKVENQVEALPQLISKMPISVARISLGLKALSSRHGLCISIFFTDPVPHPTNPGA